MDIIKDKKKEDKENKENKTKKEDQNNFGDINILKINLLLLSIALDLTKNEKEKKQFKN